MVYAVILQTADAQQPSTRILHSVLYYPGPTEDVGTKLSTALTGNSVEKPDMSTKRRERAGMVDEIARRVAAEYLAYSSLSEDSPHGRLAEFLDSHEKESETGGLFTTRLDHVTEDAPAETVVLWHAARGVGLSLACEPYENRLLASRTLVLIFTTLLRHLDHSELALEIARRPDIVTSVLDGLLRHGQLLFAHSKVVRRVVQQIQRDLG